MRGGMTCKIMQKGENMRIDAFTSADCGRFLVLATLEGWTVDPWEPQFLINASPSGNFCARESAGQASAFVTSLQNRDSGWIGNLMVHPGLRNRGVGKRLFSKALESLRKNGAATFWLTASAMGRPLYEKHGFSVIDRINRWTGHGTAEHGQGLGGVSSKVHYALDYLGWGDERSTLLEAVAARAMVAAEANAFAMLQPCGSQLQLGPCAANDEDAAQRVIRTLVGQVPKGMEIVCDVPSGNMAAAKLLEDLGFRIKGTTELMFAGVKPDYRPEYIYGLATMGSSG